MRRRALHGVVLALLVWFAAVGVTGRARADESARALRLPPMPGVAAPFWLVADGFTPGEAVTITLTTPGGIPCTAVDVQSGATDFTADELGVAQVVVAPAACAGAGVPGRWAVTFDGEGGELASATFMLLQPNQIRLVPVAPASQGGQK